MAPKNVWFGATADSDYMFKALTDGTVAKMSGGKIPKMNAAQAAGLIGSWIIESGRSISNGGFQKFDVIEAGARAGRGISQYTNVRGANWGRRSAYDQAAAAAQKNGIDPNSAQFQLQFFVDEYLGKYDRNGQSLTGWTRVFEKMPQNLKSPAEYARYFTGSAREGKGYFRPGEPHQDRRNAAALEVYRHYSTKETPKVTAPSQKGQPAVAPNFVEKLMRGLGIKKNSFNMDKLQSNMGSIAAGGDAGFAIFASTKFAKGNAKKAWNKLPKANRKAWQTVGGELGIQAFKTNPDTFKLPKSLESRVSQYKNPSDLSVGGVKPGDLGYGVTGTHKGLEGLPGLHEIAQAGIANYGYFKDKSNLYGKTAFDSSRNGRWSNINQRSYGSGLNLGGSLGINTRATAAAGARYGGAAMSMNTSAINSAAWGSK